MATKEASLLDDYRWVYRFDPNRSVLSLGAYLLLKRGLDLVLVVLSMPVWLPLMGIIALLVWVDSPGAPVFFKQMRTGKGGRRFKMWKFRSMVPNAEALLKQYAHLNELSWPVIKLTNDPRVTRVGKFLRKTSLDELPQLFNVLAGDMSLVGPRPTSFGPETYHLWQTERLDVQPGLTGVWQVAGRGETDFDDWLRMDIAYIERRCLSLDLSILLRTLGAVIQKRNKDSR